VCNGGLSRPPSRSHLCRPQQSEEKAHPVLVSSLHLCFSFSTLERHKSLHPARAHLTAGAREEGFRSLGRARRKLGRPPHPAPRVAPPVIGGASWRRSWAAAPPTLNKFLKFDIISFFSIRP